MTTLSYRALEDVLEKILEQLKANNMTAKLDIKNEKELIENVAGKLHGKISHENIQDLNVQKMLGFSLVAEALNEKLYKNNPEKQFKLETFFDEKKDMKLLKEELAQELKKLFKALNEINPKNKIAPEKADKLAQLLAEKFVDNKFVHAAGEDTLSKNQTMTDMLCEIYVRSLCEDQKMINDPKSLTLRNLYGGDDPTLVGEISYPIGPTAGNVMGYTTDSPVKSGADTSFVPNLANYNPSYPNASGLETAAFTSAIASGLQDVLSDVLAQDKILNKGTTPRPG